MREKSSTDTKALAEAEEALVNAIKREAAIEGRYRSAISEIDLVGRSKFSAPKIRERR